jgi:hypothetical protein
MLEEKKYTHRPLTTYMSGTLVCRWEMFWSGRYRTLTRDVLRVEPNGAR